MRVFRSAGKKVYFTLLASSFMFPISAFAQCVDNEDCSALGYTETTNKENCLKCPFGEYYWCPKDCEDGYEWKDGACQPKMADCEIGSILYSDKTCSSFVIDGKIPIGVVVYADGKGHGQAVAWEEIITPAGNGSYYYYPIFNSSLCSLINDEEIVDDIPTLPSILTETEAMKDFNSCENTQKMITYGNELVQLYNRTLSDYFSLADFSQRFYPKGAENTKGKWCIPSAGILNSIKDNLAKINASRILVGGIPIQFQGDYIDYYPSSTEYKGKTMWNLSFSKSSPFTGSMVINDVCYSPTGHSFRSLLVIEF